MEKQTDDQIAVSIVKKAQQLFPSFKACSFDKGFHSPANQTELQAMLDQVTLPKKGKWSASDEARERDGAFVAARKAHSAVESGINALEVHGLDKCPDHGIVGFKRYVALAVLSRNLRKIGQIKRDAERERLVSGAGDGYDSASKSSPPKFFNCGIATRPASCVRNPRACPCRMGCKLFSR